MKKRIALVLSTIMICFSSMTVMAAPAAGTNGVISNLIPYVVTGNSVNLRTNKGTWNTSLGWLDKGDLFNQAYDAGSISANAKQKASLQLRHAE